MTSPDVLLSFSAADDDCGNARYGFVSACVAYLEQHLRDAGAAIATPRTARHDPGSPPAVLVAFASAHYFADSGCASQWYEHRAATSSQTTTHKQSQADPAVVVVDLVDDWSGIPSLAANIQATDLFAATDLPADFSSQVWAESLYHSTNVGTGQFTVFKKEYDIATDGLHALPEDAKQHLGRIAQDIIELLRTRYGTTLSPTNIRATSPHWVARHDVIDQLRHTLLRPNTQGAAMLVHGLGGMGKTELSVAFAHRFRQEFAAGRWLVPCTGFSDVGCALAQLAEDARFEVDPAAPQPAALIVAKLAQRHRNAVIASSEAPDPQPVAAAAGQVTTLLVLDDVTDPALIPTAQELAATHPWLAIIMTSREPHKTGDINALDSLVVTELDDASSRLLLESFVPPHMGSARHGIDQVTHLLRGYPLSLEQAGVFVQDGYGSYAEYAALLQPTTSQSESAKKTCDDALAERIQHHQKMLSTVINSTVNSLQHSNPIAADLMRFASLLPHHHVYWPFVRAAMTTHHRTPYSEGDWLAAQREVINRRLITQPNQNSPFGQMHRLIQASITGNDTGSFTADPEGGLPEPVCHDWHPSFAHRLVMLDVIADQCESVTDTVDCGTTPEPALCVALSHALLHVVTRHCPASLKHTEQQNVTEQLSPMQSHKLAQQLDPTQFFEPSQQFSLAEWFGSNILCHKILLDNMARYVPAGRLTGTLDAIIPTLRSRCDHNPTDPDARRYLGSALLDQASLLKDSSPARAIVLIEEATRLGDILIDDDPYEAENMAFLATTLDVHAYLLRFVNQDAVKAVNWRAVLVRQQLVEADPDYLEYHNLLATTLGNHAQLVRGEDSYESNSLNDQALTIRRSLVAAAPDDAEYQHRLANLLTSYAVMVCSSSPRRARIMCEEAVGILRNLHNQDADNVEYRMRLSATLGVQATTLEKEDPQQSADSYQEATLHAEHIAVREPNNQQFRLILAQLLSKQANLVAKTDTPRAISLYERSARLLNLLVEAAPSNAVFATARSAVQEGLAECLQN